MHRFRVLMGVVPGLLLATAAGAESPVSYVGRIGTLEVVACLDADTRDGDYYYMKFGQTIHVQPIEQDVEIMVEVEPSGFLPAEQDAAHWHTTSFTDTAVTGTWRSASSAKQQRQLKIALQRLAPGCEAYNNRRLDVAEVPLTGQEENPTIQFYRHGLADVVGLRMLRGAAPEVMPKINAVLDEFFRTAVSDSFECRDYSGTSIVELYRELLLVDFTNGSYCGGPHPNEDFTVFAFDLRSGAAIVHPDNADDWLEELDTNRAGHTLTDLLLAKIPEGAGDEAGECRSALEPMAWWPSSEGMVFRLWTDVRTAAGCREDVTLPYAVVRPYVRSERLQDFDNWSTLLQGQTPRRLTPPATDTRQ